MKIRGREGWVRVQKKEEKEGKKRGREKKKRKKEKNARKNFMYEAFVLYNGHLSCFYANMWTEFFIVYKLIARQCTFSYWHFGISIKITD